VAIFSPHHVGAARHVHVDVAKANQYRQRGSLTIYFGLAQVEINIAERSTGDRPAPEFDSSALDHFAKQGTRETGSATLRSDHGQLPRGREAEAKPLKVRSNSGRISLVDPLRELLERKPPGQQVIPQPRHRLVALGIRE
jgi:hypothetical protein